MAIYQSQLGMQLNQPKGASSPIFKESHMNHTQHAMTVENHRKLGKRAEAAFDYLLCLAIGVGLAALLVAWWSA